MSAALYLIVFRDACAYRLTTTTYSFDGTYKFVPITTLAAARAMHNVHFRSHTQVNRQLVGRKITRHPPSFSPVPPEKEVPGGLITP